MRKTLFGLTLAISLAFSVTVLEPDTLTVATEYSQDVVATAPIHRITAMDYGADTIVRTPMFNTVCIKNTAKKQNQNFERQYSF